MSDAIAGRRAVVEARLAVLDQVREWIRFAMAAVFALFVLNLAVRLIVFEVTHRLPLAIMLVLTGAALFGLLLRAVLARTRAKQASELQSIRSQELINESLEATTKP